MKTTKKILAMLMSLSMLASFGTVVVSASEVVADDMGNIISTSKYHTVSDNDIREFTKSGMSSEEILAVMEERNDCPKEYLCYITVKPGTKLEIAEDKSASFRKNGDLYSVLVEVGKGRNDIKEYMKQDGFVSFEFYFQPTAEEAMQPNIDNIRKIAADGTDGECTGLYIECVDPETADRYFKDDENVYAIHTLTDESKPNGIFRTEVYLNVPNDDIEKYIDIYENGVGVSYIMHFVNAILSHAVDEFILGDANGDWVIDMMDLTNVSCYLLGENELSEIQLKAADVTGDGKVDLTDLATIKQYVSKQIESFH